MIDIITAIALFTTAFALVYVAYHLTMLEKEIRDLYRLVLEHVRAEAADKVIKMQRNRRRS